MRFLTPKLTLTPVTLLFRTGTYTNTQNYSYTERLSVPFRQSGRLS